MAPAGNKRASKASSKSKPVALPQKSILDLLTKQRVPAIELDGTQIHDDAHAAQESSSGNNVADSALAGLSVLSPVQPSPSENPIPIPMKKGLEAKATRKRQKFPKANEDSFIDITDDDSQSRHTEGPSKLAPSKTMRSASNQNICTEPSRQESLQRPQPSNGGTRHDPIILDSSSPAKPQVSVDFAKTTYSIFAPRRAPQALTPSKLKMGKVDNNTLETPFPDAVSQHVRGTQSQFIIPPLQFGRRVKMDEVIDVDEVSADLSAFRKEIIDQDNNYSRDLRPTPIRTIQPPPRDDYMKTIPDEHVRNHPAISRLVQLSTLLRSGTEPSSTPSQDLWADKWRPQRADHVLGNESHTLYLRNWLSALELQLESRPESPQKPLPNSSLNSKSTTANFVLYQPKNGKLKIKEDNDNDNRGVKRQRPRIVRTVQKLKGRKRQRVESDEEDWIVDTDDEGGEDRYADLREESEEEDVDDVEFCRKQALSRLRRIESSPPPISSSPLPQVNLAPLFSSDLHNTLLLTGPPGSGKTAAVYACAKELDWEVFEVYPGVGKRSGSSLDQLIGEVGKNHLVRKAGAARKKDDTEGKKNAFVEMFGKAKGKGKVDVDTAGHGSEAEPIKVDGRDCVSSDGKGNNGDFGFVVPKDNIGVTNPDPNAKEHTSGPIQRIRQSLILLEEVDILFEEDRGFWSAVINIIRDCRRPVIMTCNDISLVPTLDLPLQSILFFQPCPPPIAASYLQGLCFAEGRLVDRNIILQLYESTRRIDVFDMPDSLLNPLTGSLPVPDLRRAIHRLQLWGSITIATEAEPGNVLTSEMSPDEYLEDLADWWQAVRIDPVTSEDDPEKQLRVLRDLMSHAESLSFIDSHLTRRPLDTIEALVFNDHEASPDDEIGHTYLFNASGQSSALPNYYTDETICEDAIRCSRGILKANHDTRPTASSSAAFQSRALFRARVEYQSKMLDLLRSGLIPLQSHLLPRPAVFLDYLPWVRYMAQVDDAYELAGNWEANVNPRSGRMTRNSAKGSYERQLTLSDHQRGILTGTRLGELGPG